jgi:membrane-associated protease RseP (regulator of RpoE activity)
MNLISTVLIPLFLIGSLLAVPGESAACEKNKHEDDFVKSYAFKWFPEGGSFLGVHIDDVDSETAKDLNLKEEHGAHVEKVIEDTAADKAGLKKDDVIVEWNDKQVESAAQLRRLVKETPVGREVRLGLIREGKDQTVEVTMGEFSGQDYGMKFLEPLKDLKFKESLKEYEKCIPKTLDKYLHFDKKGDISIGGCKLDDLGKQIQKEVFIFKGRGRMGVTLQSFLTPQLAEYFGLKEEGGALITSVREDSPAEKAGLKAGDVILSIDGEEIEHCIDVVKIVQEKEEGTLNVVVMRDRKEESFNVYLEKEEDVDEDLEEESINL